ncbi:MAG TPA: hypothetical protein DCE41_28250 [Cytophagales bacterium]|nr:hypothetical protein [Cytophagales bacterium]
MGSWKTTLEAPAGFSARLADVDGDGATEAVAEVGNTTGFYDLAEPMPGTQSSSGRSTNAPGYENFRPFEVYPNLNWNDPSLRMVDLDGDGLADVLITEQDVLTWYRSRGQEGYEAGQQVSLGQDNDFEPAHLFSNETESLFLADMSGDGLTDIVRVRNSEVCYWPNLGYGRFGKRVVMSQSPRLDYEGQYDPRRLRLADLQGTGTTDLIYLGEGQIQYWSNQAGSAYGAPVSLANPFSHHDQESLHLTDLLGRGTLVLVTSDPLPEGMRLRYVDLTGPEKPFLLTQIDNGVGGLTRLQYAPSTQYYRRDQQAGKPWATRLPFPVQVLERTEVYDQITEARFTTVYAYHHGYYDGPEREFRGFGMVEQWDTETFDTLMGDGLFPTGTNQGDPTTYVAPVHTKTWNHLGMHRRGQSLLDHYKTEYFQGDPTAQSLGPNVLPTPIESSSSEAFGEGGHTPIYWAMRALKGATLRSEVYGEDGAPNADIPYTVSESRQEVRCLQPAHGKHPGVYHVVPLESLSYHYDRVTDDPRLSHQLVLATDALGYVTQAAQIAYPRRKVTGRTPEQNDLHVVYEQNAYLPPQELSPSEAVSEGGHAAFTQAAGLFRHGLPQQSKSYEIGGLSDTGQTLFTAADLTAHLTICSEIPYEQDLSSGAQKRLLAHVRVQYWNNDLSAALAEGQAGYHALPYRSYTLAFTPGMISEFVAGPFTGLDAAYLTGTAKYQDLDSDGNYWQPSTRQTFDAAGFFRPTQFIDNFDNTSQLTYDNYGLLPVQVTDPIGLTVSSQCNYRVLAPWETIDPNGNRQQAEFDARGMVNKSAVMGKVGDSDGDSLADPTVKISYDLFQWRDHGKPNYVHSQAREQHATANPRWQESYVYSGGLGQQVMTKIQAEPGGAYRISPVPLSAELVDEFDDFLVDEEGNQLNTGDQNLIDSGDDWYLYEEYTENRWIGNGRTVFNNKGEAIMAYEPYFSTTHEYENAEPLRTIGVSPLMNYDTLGRVVRTDYPDGTFDRVEFTPWHTQAFDRNDTVLGSQWYIDRGAPDPAGMEPTNPDERAAYLAAQHANTPPEQRYDSLGRAYHTLDNDGTTNRVETHYTFDILGLPRKMTDALGREATSYRYNVLGEPRYSTNIDRGEGWMLTDSQNQPLMARDSRNHILRSYYDSLRRPTHTTLEVVGTAVGQRGHADTPYVVSMVKYGEFHDNPASQNLFGQVWQSFDQAGRVRNNFFDFKGNPLSVSREYATNYKDTISWHDGLSAGNESELRAATLPQLENTLYTQNITYDALNRPVEMTMPDNSRVIPTYNEANLLEKVNTYLRGSVTATEFVSNINYNEKGQRTDILYGNGVRTGYTYDDKNYRLTRLLTTRQDGKILQDLGYTFDAVGNITTWRDDAHQSVFFNNTEIEAKNDYVYDALYRLTQATGRELIGLNAAPDQADISHQALPNDATALRRYTQNYTYDELGNLLQVGHNGGGGAANWNRHYHYGTNNYLLSTSNDGIQRAPDQYTYDAHGSMLSMPHLPGGLIWDFQDQLKEVNLGGGGTAYYVYSGGERVRKVVVKTGKVEDRKYLANWELYQERASESATTIDKERETLHISDDMQKLALVDTLTIEGSSAVTSPTSKIRYQLSNHLGSAALELDDSAAIISYEEYFPFGNTSYRSGRSASEVAEKRYRYVGKERDEETGLYYYGMRYFAAWLHRFVSVDPLQDKYPHYTPFQYAGNMPITFIDLDGAEGYVPPVAQPKLEDPTRNQHRRLSNAYTNDQSKWHELGSVWFHKQSKLWIEKDDVEGLRELFSELYYIKYTGEDRVIKGQATYGFDNARFSNDWFQRNLGMTSNEVASLPVSSQREIFSQNKEKYALDRSVAMANAGTILELYDEPLYKGQILEYKKRQFNNNLNGSIERAEIKRRDELDMARSEALSGIFFGTATMVLLAANPTTLPRAGMTAGNITKSVVKYLSLAYSADSLAGDINKLIAVEQGTYSSEAIYAPIELLSYEIAGDQGVLIYKIGKDTISFISDVYKLNDVRNFFTSAEQVSDKEIIKVIGWLSKDVPKKTLNAAMQE